MEATVWKVLYPYYISQEEIDVLHLQTHSSLKKNNVLYLKSFSSLPETALVCPIGRVSNIPLLPLGKDMATSVPPDTSLRSTGTLT